MVNYVLDGISSEDIEDDDRIDGNKQGMEIPVSLNDEREGAGMNVIYRTAEINIKDYPEISIFRMDVYLDDNRIYDVVSFHVEGNQAYEVSEENGTSDINDGVVVNDRT